MERQRILIVTTLIVATLTTLAACGAPPGTPLPATSASPQVAEPTPSASPQVTAPPSSSSTPQVGQTYTTAAFKVPITVIVEPLLKSPPTSDSPGRLSWDAAASANEKVRFLTPVELYPPGSSTPQPPPANYLEYLQGQAAQGAKFSNITTITVGGLPATLMTATTSTSLDGSLGCPVLGADQAEGCYGLQPEISIRIAVIDMGSSGTLLAWARTGVDAPDDAFDSMFERMLASVRFR